MLIRRLRYWFDNGERAAALREEMELHIEETAAELRARGLSDGDALAEARRRFGNVTLRQEESREIWISRHLSEISQDVRYSIRTFSAYPIFTFIAVVTLALGIAANTAIFSVVNGVILQPLAYPRPEQLVYLSTQFRSLGYGEVPVSPPEYMEFREMNQSFKFVGALTTGEVNLTAGDRPRRVRAAFVDTDLLNALQIRPAEGRLFSTGETEVHGATAPGQQPVLPIAILSSELWQTAFGGQPILDQDVEVDGRKHKVIGVLPPGTDVMDNRTEIWLPLGLNPANRLNRAQHTLTVIGRLKDDVSPESAQLELNALIETWGERIGVQPGAGAAGHVFTLLTADGGHILSMMPLQERVIGNTGHSIWILQAAGGFVLLIACANLSSLLLARSDLRHREFAMRVALGAGRGRLLRQLVTEGVLLSTAGGSLGLLFAHLGVHALLGSYPATLPRTSEITVDLVVALFTLAVSITTGIFFGLTPMIYLRTESLVNALSEGGVKGAIGGTRHPIRSGLIIAEIAMSVVLVIGAGLLARTTYNLTTVDAGFNRSNLLTFSITLPSTDYFTASSRTRTYENLLGALRDVPGVEAGTAMSGLPPSFPAVGASTDMESYTAPPQGPVEVVDYYQFVMSNYFETMGIPIVAGRSFQQTDAASQGLVAVVNETLANTFWKGQNPIGQRLRRCGRCDERDPWITVVGVAGDVKQGGVDRKTGTEIYLLVAQQLQLPSPPPINLAPGTMNFVLRTALPSTAMAEEIQGIVREADPTIPIVGLRQMHAVFAESLSRPRLLAQLIGGFAGLSLLLAGIGIYGMLSYMVTQRRREIGVRIALGATRGVVLAGVIKQALRLTAIGVVIGLTGALVLNRLIASLLFGVQPTDSTTLVTAITTITVVAVSACWLPAWRASRLDPNIMIREG